MIAWLIALFPRIPSALYLKVAAILLFGATCYATGNLHATQRAVRIADEAGKKYAVERERAVAAAYEKAINENNKKLAELADRQARADHEAHSTYQDGIRASARARMAAEKALAAERAALTKQKETNDGLKNVNQMLADAARSSPGCVLPGRVREILDSASGASDSPSDRASETDSAAVPSGSSGEAATPTNVLTCEQLSEGYVLISEWGRNGWAEADSWKALWRSLGFN